jgi:hypothetical protein
MATVTTSIDDTVYVQVATATDALVQNTSTSSMRLIFAGSLPAVDATNFHVLASLQAVQKINALPVGEIYVRMNLEGREGIVAVSE